MQSLQTLPDLNETTLTDHAQIFSALVETSRTIDRLTPTGPDPAVVDRALTQLGELESSLERHFQTEEANNLTGRLLAVLPEASSEINRVMTEHGEILGLLRAMRSRQRPYSPIAVQDLADQLAQLLELLYAHEATEDRLLAAAVVTETEHTGGRL